MTRIRHPADAPRVRQWAIAALRDLAALERVELLPEGRAAVERGEWLALLGDVEMGREEHR